MSNFKLNYNERSWAIDVISYINNLVSDNSLNLSIKRAGGENTLKNEKNNLFPDVLIYSSKNSNKILNGWELKMPDTPLEDKEFIDNAIKKAVLLNTNSFVLWNVSSAVLYVKDDNEYKIIKRWNDLSWLKSREDVEEHRDNWQLFAKKIILDLNDFFNKGIIQEASMLDAISGGTLISELLSEKKELSIYLKNINLKDKEFRDRVTLWWSTTKNEFNNPSNITENDFKFIVLSEFILMSWFNKFLFANILKNFRDEALVVNDIDENIDCNTALNLFNTLTLRCDFYNIFSEQLGEKYINQDSWKKIISINKYFMTLRLENIDHLLLQELLYKLTNLQKRHSIGQYTTPYLLAYFIVSFICQDVFEHGYDAFCGSGTIPKAIYNYKQELGMSKKEALATTWGSDKFQHSIQISTLAMTEIENIGNIINIFCQDISNINENYRHTFINPQNGQKVIKELPKMGMIISNLPFIKSEEIKKYNLDIIESAKKAFTKETSQPLNINKKADFYAYVPFLFYNILKDDGKIAIITSNSWLATTWGEEFKEHVLKLYNIETIITSGKYRWFDNAKVVTTIIILSKKKNNNKNTLSFIKLKNSLDMLLVHKNKINTSKIMEDTAILNRIDSLNNSEYSKYNYSLVDIKDLNLNWNIFFTDCKWLLDIQDKLIPITDVFKISRGARWGCNDFFYPNKDDVKEFKNEHILNAIKNVKKINTYDFNSKDLDYVFCCDKTVDELKKMNCTKEISWINTKTQINL